MAGQRFFGYVVVLTAAVLIAEVVVIYKLASRRNWARYVTLIVTVLGLLQFIRVLTQGQQIDPIIGALEALQLVLDGIALFLLFTSPARQWYKRA